jgi:probable F420-dependent oxidoreductase
MTDFGICTIPTHYTIPPVELAKWAEEQGFESLFIGEHTHIPTSRATPFPLGGELPVYYKEFFDPFVGLTAAAAVTRNLKVGTSVCLVPEHHPITLAKTISCLDQVATGRFLFGIGAGWNVEEMADHGVDFKDRWKVTRERVLAMKEIWRNEVAEFHGRFVNFDPLWCWPKPVRSGGPPVLMGATPSKWIVKYIVDYCDGWIPLDGPYDLANGLAAIRHEAERVGRPMSEFEFSVITAYALAGVSGSEQRTRELADMGFGRILFLLEPKAAEQQWPVLEQYAKLIRLFK